MSQNSNVQNLSQQLAGLQVHLRASLNYVQNVRAQIHALEMQLEAAGVNFLAILFLSILDWVINSVHSFSNLQESTNQPQPRMPSEPILLFPGPGQGSKKTHKRRKLHQKNKMLARQMP